MTRRCDVCVHTDTSSDSHIISSSLPTGSQSSGRETVFRCDCTRHDLASDPRKRLPVCRPVPFSASLTREQDLLRVREALITLFLSTFQEDLFKVIAISCISPAERERERAEMEFP